MTTYADSDFVYYDPETRTVIGPVQWSAAGTPKPLERPARPEGEGEGRRKFSRRKEYYPWGSYRSLKRLHNLEGKQKEAEHTQTLDEAMGRALQEAYWD
ncbi:MAG: hypothetical protein PHS73_02245 [Candidatus Peribacteraceae bacterium]|nr:hypothetical protein [Candidatus Peribacteraceae bacterium]